MKKHLLTAAMLALAISMTATSCSKDDDNSPADNGKTETTTTTTPDDKKEDTTSDDDKKGDDTTPVAEKVTITLPDGSSKEVEKDSKYIVSAQTTTDDGLIVKFFVNGEDVSGKEITISANTEITSKILATITFSDGSTKEVEKDSKYTVSAQYTTDDGLIVKFFVNGEDVSGKEITVSANTEVEKKEFATITLSSGSKEEFEIGAEYTLSAGENGPICYKLGDDILEPGDKLIIDKNIEITVYQVLTFADLQTADFSGKGEVFLKITDVTNENVVSIQNYLKTETNLLLAGEVTTIGEGAFEDCTSLISIVLPNSVTSIGNEAFYYCLALQSIEIPNSVTSIGDFAFQNCRLESIVIPNSVTTIGDGAFGGCRYLQSIVIPNSVTTIGIGAFYYCESLQSIEIPNSLSSIGECTFASCTSLQSVVIKNSKENISIAEDAFNGCPVEPVFQPESK